MLPRIIEHGPPREAATSARRTRLASADLDLAHTPARPRPSTSAGPPLHASRVQAPASDFEDITAIDGVCEVTWTPPVGLTSAAPSLLIEIPHGATRTRDYVALRLRLAGALPPQLEHFFYVNTDIGAPECAERIAGLLAAAGHGVLVLRCSVPRTFIDCNRVVAGVPGAMIDGMTPARASYIREPLDAALLEDLHRQYHALVDRAYARVCGRGGLGLQLHSYAPRSIGVDRVDDDIVSALHAAYEPTIYATWPERPAVDLICAGPEGLLADPALIADLRARYAAIDIAAEENATYRLHPATMGYHYARSYPAQVLCVELNRDLLADPFVPFGESPISPAKVARMSQPIADALQSSLDRRA